MRSAKVFEKLNRVNDGTRSLHESMINTGQVNLDGWPLSTQNITDYNEILTRFV